MIRQDRRAAPGRVLDWQAAHRDLARFKANVDAAQNPPPERVRQVLRERAAALAKPRAEARPAAVARLIIFSRRGHRWAVDASQVREVIELPSLTPLPGVPATYLGLIHHRGEVYPVVDIGVPFGITAGEGGKHAQALIVDDNGTAVAIAADAIEGHAMIDAASIAEMTPEAATHPALQGLTPDLATVFDAHLLLADARLVVNDQPAASARSEGEK